MSFIQLNNGHVFDEINGELVTLAKLNRMFTEGGVTFLNPLPIEFGGTGCSDVACAREALGVVVTDFNLLTYDANPDVATDLIAYFDDSEGDHNTLTFNDLKVALGLSSAGGNIIQVLQTVKSDTATVATKTWTDISGLAQVIIPASASNKILVTVQVLVAASAMFRLDRNGTTIFIGDAAGSRAQASINGGAGSGGGTDSFIIKFLDSPASVAAQTYKVQWRTRGSGTSYLNRSINDTDDDESVRGTSSITTEEVSV